MRQIGLALALSGLLVFLSACDDVRPSHKRTRMGIAHDVKSMVILSKTPDEVDAYREAVITKVNMLAGVVKDELSNERKKMDKNESKSGKNWSTF